MEATREAVVDGLTTLLDEVNRVNEAMENALLRTVETQLPVAEERWSETLAAGAAVSN